MFTPDPLSRHRLLPPDWFVLRYNTNRPGEAPATWLDPGVMALWLAFSLQPPPSPLSVNGAI
jgi:hypothetical protein